MICPMCGGKGYHWVGLVDEAHREVCEPCQGTGRGRVQWAMIPMLIYTLAAWALVLGVIWWSTTRL